MDVIKDYSMPDKESNCQKRIFEIIDYAKDGLEFLKKYDETDFQQNLGFQEEPRPSHIVSQRFTEISELAYMANTQGLLDLRIYGSVARGDDTEKSDVDFLVTVDETRSEPPHKELYSLRRDLKKLLDPVEASVAVFQEMFPCVLREIDKDVRHILPEYGVVWTLQQDPLPHDAAVVIANRTAVRIHLLDSFLQFNAGVPPDIFHELLEHFRGWCLEDIASYGLTPAPPDIADITDSEMVETWIREFCSAHSDIAQRVQECKAAQPGITRFREWFHQIECVR